MVWTDADTIGLTTGTVLTPRLVIVLVGDGPTLREFAKRGMVPTAEGAKTLGDLVLAVGSPYGFPIINPRV